VRHQGVTVLFSKETNNNMEYNFNLCLIEIYTLNEAEMKFYNLFNK
jgi:hypothetical protein